MSPNFHNIKHLLSVLIGFSLLFASSAFAANRIAVFDPEAAVLNTEVAKSRLAAIRSTKDYKNDVAKLEETKKSYDSLVADFKKQFDILSLEQRQAAKNRIDMKRSDGEHLARKIEAANKLEAQAIMTELAPKLQAILPELVKDENIGLLLPRNVVMHADESYDITSKVADKLNKQK